MNLPPSDHSGDEPARDAWLSEALRHAPDADAAPSVAVRETILRQARAQAAAAPMPARPASAWQRFNAAWSWLSGPRVAAGFASVMVATVVGLMWWDRPIDEALRPVEPPATVAAPEATAPAPASAPTPTPPTPVPAPAPAAPAAEPPAAAPPAPSVESPRDLAAKAPPPAALERKREAKQQRADTSNDARSEAAGVAAAPTAPAAKRAADEARAQADATDSARTEKETREVDATRERRAEATQAKGAAAPALRSAPTAAAGSLYAPAPAQAPPPAAAAPSRQARPAPLGALLEALSEESPRWRWQRDGSGERPWSSEMQAWVQRLDRTTAGRWSSADAGQGSGQAPSQQLRLLRDGGVQATVRLGADGTVRVDIAGESPLIAQLPAASAAALQRALDDATR